MDRESARGYLPQMRARAGGRGLVRPRQGKLVAGVLAGLARRFGISPWAARVLFLLSLLLPGPQVLAYVALWILMPSEE
jgi:phage shock protein C